jgi:hypothetical protein
MSMSGTGARGHAYRRPSLPNVAKVTIGLLVLLGLVALPSGWILMTPAPGEAPMGLPLERLESSPFSTYFIPGLLLFTVFGIGSLVAAWFGARRSPAGPYLAFAIGVGQMIWISVQVLMLSAAAVPADAPGGVSFLQPALFTYGAVTALLSYLWWRKVRFYL